MVDMTTAVPGEKITMYDKDALIELVRAQALQFGDFTLASGNKATYYLDCRKVTLDARGARLVGEGMLDLLAEEMPPLVGGMAIGADPITASILALAGTRDLSLRGVIVRKESKQHGTGKYVEGPFEPGEKLVIVEDVVTTGGSSLLAIERCEAVGLKVERVLAIVDRMEGGREAFAERGYELTTLLTIEDFGIEPPVK
jgi:orotate phosphoribosyltransferase